MQVSNPRKVQSAINVTPLVDVVLVLLIIFMVIAPQLQSGPVLRLPETDRPSMKSDDGAWILVAIEPGGTIWVENERVTADGFAGSIRAAAERGPERQVVIKGDARLTFGEVKQAMFAVEAAGFRNVALIADRREPVAQGS